MHKNSVSQLPKKSSTPYQQSMPKLQFLCPHHRDWVYFNSQEATQYLAQIQMKGEFLLQHHQYSKALPFLGSAWETANILMELLTTEHTVAVQRLVCLSALLQSCFRQLKQPQCAEQVRRQTSQSLANALEHISRDSPAHFYTTDCLEQLSKPAKDRSALQLVGTSNVALLRH